MDFIIEILIGLAFIAVPAIFKWIGKSFEKAAGHPMQHPSIPDALEQIFEEWSDGRPEGQPETPVYRHEIPASTVEMPISAKPREEAVKKIAKPVVDPEPVRKKEKIDPKKLVVYSEIMKPKYTE